MKRATHRRLPTSGSVNLPMIATKCLQHPSQKQMPLVKGKLSTMIPLEKKTLNNINNNTIVPSMPSTTTVSRRSSQFSKSKPFLVKRKESEITENRIIVNVGQMKKRNSVGVSQQSKRPILLQNPKRRKNETENQNPKAEQQENDCNALPFELKTIENKLKHPALEFLFDKDYQNTLDAKLSKPYHLDGDIRLYTKDALQKRKDLRTFENVQIAINRFMDDCFQFDKQQMLQKINYLAAFFKISLILRSDLSHERPQDYEEIKNILEEDWQRDAKGNNKITRQQLFNSLFELADVWTPGIDASQCVSFFETLRYKFAIEGVKPKINIYDILS